MWATALIGALVAMGLSRVTPSPLMRRVLGVIFIAFGRHGVLIPMPVGRPRTESHQGSEAASRSCGVLMLKKERKPGS